MKFPFSLSLRLFRPEPSSSTRFRLAGLKALLAMLLMGSCALSYAQDETTPVLDQPNAVEVTPVLRHHVMRPAVARPGLSQFRSEPKLRLAPDAQSNGVNTGIGIVYTCAANVPASACTYLNTKVAGYYNSIFKNANANIYVQFGATGLGASVGYINLIHYTPYVTALTNKAVKSSIQASALSAINTYATPAYGTQNIMSVTVALGAALGFTGLSGITPTEASCTPYTAGCYNEIVTVADAATQKTEGFTLYYDDQGGTETANQYDFYAVVQHETDEVLGTSSCISTQDAGGLSDECDLPAGSNGVPSAVDLLRYASPGKLALDTTPSTTPGQYYSYDGGKSYGISGDGKSPKVYNTLDNNDDFADYTSSSPDCGTNQAIQDAEGCPGEDAGLTVLNDGQSEITILNTDGYDIPEAIISSPAPGSTLSGTSATFTWPAVAGATDYWLYVGTTGIGSSNIFNTGAATTATSQAVTGLPTTGTVYVRVYSYLNGFWTSTDYTYKTGSAVPVVSLSSTLLTFASTLVGSTTAAQTVTIKNTGTAALTLTSETLTGTNPTSFIISANTCTTSLAVNATCAVSVEFKPAAAGALTAFLSIADNAAGSPQAVQLNGTGTSPMQTVSLTPTSIVFPETVVGMTSVAQIVTLKNTGTLTVTIGSIALGGTNGTSFKQIGTCGSSLAAGASCSIYVGFHPASAAALTGTLSITDNAAGSPQTVTLTGTGTTAPAVKLSATSLSFPTTKAGSTSLAQSLTVTNSGAIPLNLASISLTGTNPTDFVELNTCGPTLSPAKSCAVYVAFKPASAAAFTATLSIADSGASSPQKVTLSGTGN